jgi:hypothetical protein
MAPSVAAKEPFTVQPGQTGDALSTPWTSGDSARRASLGRSGVTSLRVLARPLPFGNTIRADRRCGAESAPTPEI